MSYRLVKRNSTLQKDIAQYISRNIRTHDTFITISYVALFSNVQSIHIGFICTPEENGVVNKITTLLHAHEYEIQRMISSRYQFKKIPKIIFIHDTTSSSVNRIDQLIHQIKND